MAALARVDGRPPGDLERGRVQREVARTIARSPELLDAPELGQRRRQLASWARLAPHLLDDEAEAEISSSSAPVLSHWISAVRDLDADPATSLAAADEALSALDSDDPAARTEGDRRAHEVAARRAPVMAAALNALTALQHEDDQRRGLTDWRARAALVQGTTAALLREVVDGVLSASHVAQTWSARVERYEDRRYVPATAVRRLEVDARLTAATLAATAPALADRAERAAAATTNGPVSECVVGRNGELLVTVSYRGTVRSTLATAHEVAHAVHALVAGADEPPGALVGETVGCVGALLVGRRLVLDPGVPGAQRALGDLLVEELFLSAAASRFEDVVHERIAAGLAIDVPALDEAWLAVHRDVYGDALAVPEHAASGWARHPAFVTRPGHAVSYAWADLAALCALDGPAVGQRVERTVLAGAVDADDQLALLGIRPDGLVPAGLAALRATMVELSG